jgi:hypothetical protein
MTYLRTLAATICYFRRGSWASEAAPILQIVWAMRGQISVCPRMDIVR